MMNCQNFSFMSAILVKKLFEEKNINFRAFNEIKEPIKLPYGFCRQANLIFKEAMTNAFKYSEAQKRVLNPET